MTVNEAAALQECSADPGRERHMEGSRAERKSDGSDICILIAGLGNVQLQDDGVGVHSARELGGKGVAQAGVVTVGAEALEALHLFEQADKILVIDTMRAGGLPGTIYSHSVFELDMPCRRSSVHQSTLIDVLRSLPRRPGREVKILGVEPAVVAAGDELSPVLQEALPIVVRIAEEIILCWRTQASGLKKAAVR